MSDAPSAERAATDDAIESVRYQIYWWWHALIGVIAGFFVLHAVVLLANSVSQRSAGETVFFCVWLVGSTLLLRFYAYSVASSLMLFGDTLIWRAPRRTRRVDITDLVAVRPYLPRVAGPGVIEALEMADGTRLLVMVRKGLPEFARELARRRPGMTVEFGFYSDMCERLRRQSGFSRDTIA